MVKSPTLAKWLGKKLFENDFIFIDRWSIVHFIVGISLMSIFNFLPTVIILIILYEIFEFTVSQVRPDLIRPEKLKDIISDLAIGTLGAIIQTFL